MEDLISQVPITSSDSDHTAAFEQFYGKDFGRSVHLCITGPDGKSTMEIAGLDNMIPECKLKAKLVFDREQSCIELEARFARDDASMTFSTVQKMSLRFYVKSIDNPEYMQCRLVEKEDQIPVGLQPYAKAHTYFKRNELWLVELEYIPDRVVTEGLFDKLGFTDAEKNRCVTVLRQVPKTNDIKLFMRLNSNTFSSLLDQLKKKMRYEANCPPFREYIDKRSGRYTLQWGNSQFGPDKDTYVRRATNTFNEIDHFRLTHGYGVMRESAEEFKYAVESLNSGMMASFLPLAGSRILDGLPTGYIAFVQCDNEDLIRQFYNVGQSGTFAFELPKPGFAPVGWQYQIKPPIPGYEYPGNLVFQLRRARGDTRVVPVGHIPKPDMVQQEVWAFPDVSDLAPRRLIVCANQTKSLGDDADEMRRYILALDLSEHEKHHGLFSNLSELNAKSVQMLLNQLSASHQGAYDYVKNIMHPIALLQGPPGTGKTTFIVTLLQIATQLNYSWITAAPTNSATDHLATVLMQKCPEMGAIRYHAYDNEARAIRRQEQQQLAADSDLEGAKEPLPAPEQQEALPEREYVTADPQAGEDVRNFYAMMADLHKTDEEWSGSKLQRPNFKDMGLHVRALQNARVIPSNLECFAPTEHDPHADFREGLYNGDFAKTKTDEEKSAYKQAEDLLMIDTIRKSSGLITTLWKTGDPKLIKAIKPVMAVIDECCQSTELETLLLWAHNTETVLILILIGDLKQLPPTVKTKNANTMDQMVNPFADQMARSFFERLWRRGFPTYLLTEQYRLAAGLEEIFNEQFYGNKVTNADCTKIENRPDAQKAIDWIRSTYNLYDSVPHVCLNVTNGVCLRTSSKSRYNLHNIVATAHTIVQMLELALWTEADITVITPYREQAKLYRKVFRKLKLFNIKVFTVDSMQGRENKCVIFDIVLSFLRVGNWGFVLEGLRLNVAVSRARDMFIMVCDLAALEPSSQHTRALDKLSPEEREDRETQERGLGKNLRGIFNYWRKKRMVSLVDPTKYKEINLVDMTEANQFKAKEEASKAKNTCRKCGEENHRASECTKEIIGKCRRCGVTGDHHTSLCPRAICGNCKDKGHTAAICDKPNTRPCGNCGALDHFRKDCTEPRRKKMLFSFPHVPVQGHIPPEELDQAAEPAQDNIPNQS